MHDTPVASNWRPTVSSVDDQGPHVSRRQPVETVDEDKEIVVEVMEDLHASRVPAPLPYLERAVKTFWEEWEDQASGSIEIWACEGSTTTAPRRQPVETKERKRSIERMEDFVRVEPSSFVSYGKGWMDAVKSRDS